MDRKKINCFSAASIALMTTGFSGAVTAAEYDVDFDPADFPRKPHINAIDNTYWPLLSGTSFVYSAETEDGCEVNMVTVTSRIKKKFDAPYDTVAALEVDDLEWFREDECVFEEDVEYTLMEKTTDWYAQDNFVGTAGGNIWYLGEETEAYEEEFEVEGGDPIECITDEGAWEAGQDGATAGIVMLGSPVKGLTYQQEYLEGEAEDMGQVLSLSATVELEDDIFGPFAGCLKTKEWTPLEPGSNEHKYYCPPVGLVLINELQGKTVRVEYIGEDLPDGDFPEDLPDVGDCPAD
ncbi:hypothetical protein GWP57_13970 [Gammaproteobacteria bacterium]|jgi:hypothetical protein|nr:hypothetical protein [Gammaproteobacteria bacterium]